MDICSRVEHRRLAALDSLRRRELLVSNRSNMSGSRHATSRAWYGFHHPSAPCSSARTAREHTRGEVKDSLVAASQVITAEQGPAVRRTEFSISLLLYL